MTDATDDDPAADKSRPIRKAGLVAPPAATLNKTTETTSAGCGRPLQRRRLRRQRSGPAAHRPTLRVEIAPGEIRASMGIAERKAPVDNAAFSNLAAVVELGDAIA